MVSSLCLVHSFSPNELRIWEQWVRLTQLNGRSVNLQITINGQRRIIRIIGIENQIPLIPSFPFHSILPSYRYIFIFLIEMVYQESFSRSDTLISFQSCNENQGLMSVEHRSHTDLYILYIRWFVHLINILKWSGQDFLQIRRKP